jgi:hypothetical protein
MAMRDIPRWLLENGGFQEHLEAVTIEMASSELGETFIHTAECDRLRHNWQYLLLAASALAVSPDGDCQAAALRIAQFCLSSDATSTAHRESAALILDILANQPAIALAIRRKLVNPGFQMRLPTPAQLESFRRGLDNSVELNDGTVITVNRFQKRFWSAAVANDWLSVSAPTSTGKSCILTRWVREYVRRVPRATVVYLVPTRALISEVERDFRVLFTASTESPAAVSSLPLRRVLSGTDPNILVFTQERLHLLLAAVPHLKIDLLVVDEAHKIGDRQRGVLLQAVVEQVVADNPSARVIFSSPMTSNPDVLLADAGSTPSRAAFTSEDITVNQNLFWVSQRRGHPRCWEVLLCLPGRQVELGEIALPALPSPESKRLSFVTFAIGALRPGNIVYVNGAAEAEKVATQLFDLSTEGVVSDARIDHLVELAERTVHREFLLAKVLRRGIAFHYGNLPLLIRSEIEKLFSAGLIRYLVYLDLDGRREHGLSEYFPAWSSEGSRRTDVC